VSLVERGADEVVHGGVGDDEGFAAIFFDVEDGGEQGSGLSDEEASGFEQEMKVEAAGGVEELAGVGGDGSFGVEGGVGVLDAETAACIDVC